MIFVYFINYKLKERKLIKSKFFDVFIMCNKLIKSYKKKIVKIDF